jgi:lipopolysaccharide/colanic/teichoic acid biosynthesis glycosyltransferase
MLPDDHHPAVTKPSQLTLALKRVFDFVVSGLAVVLLLPFFLVVAAAIKLDSPGPVFFRQARVGRGGHLFRIFKFRTMVDGASRAGTALTVKDDPRITRLGTFLRARKIDELPQLFNVFDGSMSLVGPRPEVPEYMEFYTCEQRAIILSMRPGITDYAAVLFRDENKMLDRESDAVNVYRYRIMPIKFTLYERYSREIGLGTDLRLIFATVALLIFSKSLGWFKIDMVVPNAVSPDTVGGQELKGNRLSRSGRSRHVAAASLADPRLKGARGATLEQDHQKEHI